MITIEALRHFRLGPYAIFDLSVAFLGMALVAPLLSKLFLKFRLYVPKLNWVLLTLPIALVVHLLIGQHTQMTKDLLDPQGHVVIKIIFLVFLALGLRGIKVIKRKA